jgi:hypothetical protein
MFTVLPVFGEKQKVVWFHFVHLQHCAIHIISYLCNVKRTGLVLNGVTEDGTVTHFVKHYYKQRCKIPGYSEIMGRNQGEGGNRE